MLSLCQACGHRGGETEAGIYRECEAKGFQLVFRAEGGTRGKVHEVRPLGEAAWNFSQLFAVHRSFDEQNVGTRFSVSMAPFDSGVESFDSDGVGAGDNEEVFGPARIDGRLEF